MANRRIAAHLARICDGFGGLASASLRRLLSDHGGCDGVLATGAEELSEPALSPGGQSGFASRDYPMGYKSNRRLRHSRVISSEIPSALANSGVFLPVAANNTIRPRSTFWFSAVRRPTNFSNLSLSASVSFTSGGFGPGMICSIFSELAYLPISPALFQP
jgi:hypothetical protein